MFDGLSQRIPDEDVEFWFARDLMEPLGYARWENFMTAIQRAVASCKSTGYVESDHFRGVTKMVSWKGVREKLQNKANEHLFRFLEHRQCLGTAHSMQQQLLYCPLSQLCIPQRCYIQRVWGKA